MAIRKFVAPTTREAMIQVRRELGDDAVIIANRRVGNRIEILAGAPDAVEALVERSETRAAAPMRERTPTLERAASRAEPRPKVEAFQDFVRRQMQTDIDAPAPQRPARETAREMPRERPRDMPVRASAVPAQRGAGNTSLGSTAGVAMYHDVAEFNDEELAAPIPARATTLPHSHRAQQVENTAPAADPAVFRRRPAHVTAPVRAEAPLTVPAAAPHAVSAAPPIDILLEPQPAPLVAVTAARAQAVVEQPVAKPTTVPVAAGHAAVPELPVRTQAAPIATAARLREASRNAAAASAAARQPARVATPPEATALTPQPRTNLVQAPVAQGLVAPALVAPALVAPALVAPIAQVHPAPAQSAATWSWEAQFVTAPVAPSVPQPPAVLAPVSAPIAVPAQPAQPPQAAVPAQPRMESELLAELQSMRDILRQQIATLAIKPAPEAVPPSAPAMRVMTRLLTAGFSVDVARRIAAHVPQNADAAQAEAWLLDVLAHNIRCAEPAEGIVERAGQPGTPGQIFALVGPTGVGKTTTVAKLAARFAVRHGTSALGLVTLDAYRAAAPEQLRTYGRILGTPVHLAQDSATLRELLATLVHKRLVLIDTCGVSQRDERLGEMLDLLTNAGTANRPIQRVLLMNSASHAETLEEAARAWRAPECAGAILTKLDEATRIGGSLDVSLRHRLTLLGLTNGQRVPEDWHAAGSKLLAHLALKPAAQLFDLADEEGAALVHAQTQTTSAGAHGVTHG
jgi:flagellar biosynthesis protein FlhF